MEFDNTQHEGSRITLGLPEIHLWLAFYDQINDETLHAAYRRVLDPNEIGEESRFHFARDRKRYLVTRALVRTVLARYLQIEPKNCVFSRNSYGRPEIDNDAAREIGLTFNLSHTHSLIVLGVSRNRALGVDVENIEERSVSIDVANHFFAPGEVAALAQASAAHQRYRFFEYWTFKESYIKARGMGLALPLDKFCFLYPDDQSVSIVFDRELADDSLCWQFWQFRPKPEYLIAICGERVTAESPRLTIRQIVPMVGEKALVTSFLRTS